MIVGLRMVLLVNSWYNMNMNINDQCEPANYQLRLSRNQLPQNSFLKVALLTG